jgi:hypothetical protein
MKGGGEGNSKLASFNGLNWEFREEALYPFWGKGSSL